MKRRLRTIFAVPVIMVLGTSLLLWICNAILGTHQFIAAGRGRTTLELSSNAAAVSLRITSYTKPLTLQHPDATFIRTTGYGWFVGETRGTGLRLLGFELSRWESDYEAKPGVLFMTEWTAELPYWLITITITLLAVALLWSTRWLRRVRSRARELGIAILRQMGLTRSTCSPGRDHGHPG